jgi:hypothetical protein
MTIAMTRKASLFVAVVAALVAVPSAFGYGWPLKPFHRAHPIRGNFGDPRTVFQNPFAPDGLFGPGAFAFHNGIDVAALPGQPVYPVVSGVARVHDLAEVTVRASRRRVFKYMHISPDVYDGQRVKAYRTVLGHVDAVASHVHLSEIDSGFVVNPLGTHHLVPYWDSTSPRVPELLLAPRGGRFSKTRGATGSIELAADAYDAPALPVPGSWFGYPVAPAVVSWSMTNSQGRDVVRPTIVADFRFTIPANRQFWRVYARGTYQNKPRFGFQQFRTWPGKYVFRLTKTALDTTKLPDGPYLIKVTAEDSAGNKTTRSETITVCNADPDSCTAPPQS